MRAWKVEKHGGPEVLKLVDLPKPKPGPKEALVKVENVGLNHLDVWVMKGVPGHKFPLPLTNGCDVAGKIEELGEGAAEVLEKNGMRVGSPVIVSPGFSCGICEACLLGLDQNCLSYGLLGETRDGGCTEFISVPVINLIPRPSTISTAEAACLPINFLTAWSMVVRKGAVRPGEVVLVHAGGSGVSVAAIQMAKMFGCTVITTVGNPEKIQKARQLGADFVIDYKKTPFREELKSILKTIGKKGCDMVVDHIGVDTFRDSIKCLVPGGRVVTCGTTSGGEVTIDLKQVFFKNLSILGTTMGSKGDLIRIVDLVARGKLKPIIDKTYPMTDLPQALEYLDSRRNFGKTVLTGF